MTRSSGFTLLEALLSFLLISIMAGLSLPFYMSLQTRNDLDVTAQSVASMLRRAQIYSRAVNYDSQWGVGLQPDAVVLFKGASYASRDASQDEIIYLPGQIGVSGVTEVVFAKDTASPNATGSIVLQDQNNTRTITLNAKGMVDY